MRPLLNNSKKKDSQQLDLLSDQIKAPLTRCSRDLRYQWVNQYYADWLSRPLDKIVGRPILEVVGKEAFQKLQPRFDRVLARDTTPRREPLLPRALPRRFHCRT